MNLARALAAEPDLILCDEVTSALDTVVGAAILDLMAQLRRELGVSYMFISHDLNTVRAVCDDIVVLYAGHKVEAVPRRAFDQAARHPYFDLLATSVPELRRGWLDQVGRRNASSCHRRHPAVGARACASQPLPAPWPAFATRRRRRGAGSKAAFQKCSATAAVPTLSRCRRHP